MSDNLPVEPPNEPIVAQQVGDDNVPPSFSRDQFLEIFEGFQKDLYREGITESLISAAITSQLSKNALQKNGSVDQYCFQIKTLRFRTPEDISNALRLYYQSANRLRIPLLYVLSKENGIVTLRLGSLQSISESHKAEKTFFKETAKILPSVLPGFLPGTDCVVLEDNSLQDSEVSKNYMHRRVIFGVPSEKKSQQPSQSSSDTENGPNEKKTLEFGIERVLDAVDDDFMIIGLSTPVPNKEINRNQAIFAAAMEFFHLLAKQTEQISHSLSSSTNWGQNESDTDTVNEKGTSTTYNYGDAVGTSLKKMFKRWWGKEGWFRGEDMPTARKTVTVNQPGNSHGHQTGRNWGGSESETEQKGVTVERTNELARQTEALLSRQMKRFEKGLAGGMWRHSTQVIAKKSITAERVANILCGYWGGNDITLAQVRSVKVSDDLTPRLPVFNFGMEDLNCIDSPLGADYSGISTLLTTEELSLVAPLPLHEVPGVVVEKLTDYGRNFEETHADKQVKIGDVVDHENLTKQEIKIGFEQLKRHAFVTGATGAGKSTTMRQMLLNLHSAGIPFLVIEPIKREYRGLKEWIPDLQVITLGTEDCNVSLNPFNIEPRLGLIPHIDNLKAAFNATMGNYSSMPFILEDMIYRAYEECGWDLESGKNPLMEKLAPTGTPAHVLPIMSDLLPLVTSSIENFFPNQSDYGNSLLGALRARISSMTRGAKGAVLNSTINAISMENLLKKPCVIELWPFTDNEEKAFIMALLMIKLYEYRQNIDIADDEKKDRPLEHVLVIEEAHRLLAKPASAGEHTSNGRQKAVEFFADILAEIRSYGQGIVVVDQIPSKLIPDVLKNTDVKIAHRLADKEDREVLGGTMNLTPEQMKDVAKLKPGEGIVYFGGLRQAIKIKVPLVSKVEKEKKDRNEARKFH